MFGRGKLVRLLIEKEESDRALLLSKSSSDHRDWYSVDSTLLDDHSLRSCFVQSSFDEDTDQFIQHSLLVSNNICLQIYYSAMATLLSLVLTKTSINGLLGRGEMFVFSRGFLQKFLGLPDDWASNDKRLIDIGAGDGAITLVLQQFFGEIIAVEASKIMEWRLAQRKFKILDVDKWQESGPYDLICALNLLDRHYSPTKLLEELHSLAMANNCPVLLSVVLPINHYVEFNLGGGRSSGKAKDVPFSSKCKSSFEKQTEALVNELLVPAGFELIRWTRLPYLSEGDMSRAFYKLNDAVFLLRAIKMEKRKEIQNNKESHYEL